MLFATPNIEEHCTTSHGALDTQKANLRDMKFKLSLTQKKWGYAPPFHSTRTPLILFLVDTTLGEIKYKEITPKSFVPRIDLDLCYEDDEANVLLIGSRDCKIGCCST